MSTRSLISKIFIFSILLQFSAHLSWAQSKQYPQDYNKPFAERSYYNDIFDKGDKKIIASVDKLTAKGDKRRVKAEDLQKESDELQKIISGTKDPKTRLKVAKKKSKVDNKMYKCFFKAHAYYVQSNKLTYDLYTANMKEARRKDTAYWVMQAEVWEQDAAKLIKQAQDDRKQAPSKPENGRLQLLIQADNSEVEANGLLEDAFHAYLVGLPDSLRPKPAPKVQLTPYNANNDDNLYRSHINDIKAKVQFTAQELALLSSAEDKDKQARDIMLTVDGLYITIGEYQAQMDTEQNPQRKTLIEQQKVLSEADAIAKEINAVNKQIEANENRYNAYKAQLPKYKPADTSSIVHKRGTFLEKESESYYLNAQNLKLQARTRMYKHEQNEQLLLANENLLRALIAQEYAFEIYLGLTQMTRQDSLYAKNNKQDSSKTSNVVTPPTGGNTTGKTTTNTTTNNTATTGTKSAGYTYSATSPALTPLVHDQGIVFKVQVGVFANLLDAKKFTALSPITQEPIAGQTYKRYLVGKYKTEEAGQIALQAVKDMGFPDAFLVAYNNGVRMQVSDARALIAKGGNVVLSDYNQIKNIEVNALNQALGKANSGQTTSQGSSATNGITDIRTVQGSFYTVQIATSNRQASPADLGNLLPLYSDNSSGLYKYMSGNYASAADADAAKQRIRQAGKFADAFVVYYQNGTKGNASAGNTTTTTSTRTQTTAYTGNVSYQVQVASYNGTVPTADKTTYSQIPGFNAYSSGSQTTYTVGKYGTFMDAARMRARLVAQGYTDCFVVAYKGNQKISLDEADELLGQ